MRRDTTINALLYNIHTRSVEDHTLKVFAASDSLCYLLSVEWSLLSVGTRRPSPRYHSHTSSAETNLS
jgi:hypothetical protein